MEYKYYQKIPIRGFIEKFTIECPICDDTITISHRGWENFPKLLNDHIRAFHKYYTVSIELDYEYCGLLGFCRLYTQEPVSELRKKPYRRSQGDEN